MSTETNATVDRTKCKAWCGHKSWNDDMARVQLGRAEGEGYVADGENGTVRAVWCTAACRDARLPPIAAPVAQPQHIERRGVEVGQRRRSHHQTYIIYAIEGRCAFVCKDGDVEVSDGYVHDGGCCWESIAVLEDCELIADAPETGCQVGCVMCQPHAPKKSPLVQEAPKAAPVCSGSARIKHAGAPIARIIFSGERIVLCDACYLADEDYSTPAFKPSEILRDANGKPYAGPALIDRRLAVDWVEDCLPEAGR